MIVDIVGLLIALFGTIFLYRTNAKGDDKEFIERYICIGFPVGVQTILLGFVVSVVLCIVLAVVFETGAESETTLPDAVCGILSAFLIFGYFYFRLYQAIKIASR